MPLRPAIADEIADARGRHGPQVHVSNAADVLTVDAVDPVVPGSAVRYGGWPPAGVEFVRRCEPEQRALAPGRDDDQARRGSGVAAVSVNATRPPPRGPVDPALDLRCPLTDLAESLRAEHGSVTDIYLPAWFVRHLPAIHLPLLVLAAGPHRRNLRGRSAGRGRPGAPLAPGGGWHR